MTHIGISVELVARLLASATSSTDKPSLRRVTTLLASILRAALAAFGPGFTKRLSRICNRSAPLGGGCSKNKRVGRFQDGPS